MGIFALLVSLIALVSSFLIMFVGYWGIVLAVCSIALSVAARKRGDSGLGTAALVLSIIAVVVSGVTYAACYACGVVANEVGNAVNDSFGGFLGN